jgi:hypothetical protein
MKTFVRRSAAMAGHSKWKILSVLLVAEKEGFQGLNAVEISANSGVDLSSCRTLLSRWLRLDFGYVARLPAGKNKVYRYCVRAAGRHFLNHIHSKAPESVDIWKAELAEYKLTVRTFQGDNKAYLQQLADLNLYRRIPYKPRPKKLQVPVLQKPDLDMRGNGKCHSCGEPVVGTLWYCSGCAYRLGHTIRYHEGSQLQIAPSGPKCPKCGTSLVGWTYRSTADRLRCPNCNYWRYNNG